MLMNEYVVEKLRELDEERLAQAVVQQRGKALGREGARRSKPVIGPAMLLVGRTLRRAGEGLEGWGGQRPTEGEQRWAERHTG